MKPEVREEPFNNDAWLFELKYDGFRILAGRGREGVRLAYRSGKDPTRIFPELVRAVAELPFESLILDGEVVLLDAAGRPSFQALQRRALRTGRLDVERAAAEAPATFFAFDLLALEGFDLRPLPLVERKALLRRVLPQDGPLRYIDDVRGRGEDLYQAVAELGLEGIVAKRAASPYRGGYSKDWLKVRVDRASDFAVVGFTPAGPSGFRKLHLAVYEDGGFLYAGRVGTGFTVRGMAELRARLEPLRRSSPPFDRPVPEGGGVVWVEPELVCEVRYKEWTEGGQLRQPVFLHLRDDKRPEECRRPAEPVDPVPAEPAGPAGPGEAPVPPEVTGREPPRETKLTRLDKVFWPEEGYTKGDLVDYYRTVAPWLLPYLRGRPLVVDRFPDGIGGKSFFQKNAPASAAGVLRTVPIRTDGRAGSKGKEIDFFLCEDEASLVYLANLAAIPLHIWSSRLPELDRPDWCILDLDPKKAPFRDVVRIAQEIRTLADEIGLEPFVKTSGGSGLHVLLPLGKQLDHDAARQLAELLARVIVDRLPAIATTARTIAARGGRVYVDALQNGRGKLLAAPLSVRPLPGATVSTPLSWGEVDGGLDVRTFTIRTVPPRLRARNEDPLRPVLEVRPDLAAILGRLAERV